MLDRGRHQSVVLVSDGLVHPSLPARFRLRQGLAAQPEYRFRRVSSLETLFRLSLTLFQAIVLFVHKKRSRFRLSRAWSVFCSRVVDCLQSIRPPPLSKRKPDTKSCSAAALWSTAPSSRLRSIRQRLRMTSWAVSAPSGSGTNSIGTNTMRTIECTLPRRLTKSKNRWFGRALAWICGCHQESQLDAY
jgi:hypothetical protein